MMRQNSVLSMPSWTMSPISISRPVTDVGAAKQGSGKVELALLALQKPQSMPRPTPEITFSLMLVNSNDVLVSATLDSIVDTKKTKTEAIELLPGWGMFRTRGGIILWMKIISEKSRAYDMFEDTLPIKLIFSAVLLKNGVYEPAGVLNLMAQEVCEESTNVQAIKECTDEGIFNLSLGGYIRVRNEDHIMDQVVNNWVL